ncbi:MAG: hypothetical protein ACC726_14895 [Chloroflexota bacterium]
MDLSLRLGQAGEHLQSGDVRGLLRKVIYSETIGIVSRRDLTDASGPRASRIDCETRTASQQDVDALLSFDRDHVLSSDEESQRRLQRRLVARLGVENCYVADRGDMGPCFMIYLFCPEDNEMIQAKFPGLYPVLAPDEALVEFLYVAPRARRFWFATECLILVTEEARRRGARSVITITGTDNRGASMVLRFAGFRAESVRRSKYRFFRRTITHGPRGTGISDGPTDVPIDRSS